MGLMCQTICLKYSEFGGKKQDEEYEIGTGGAYAHPDLVNRNP
jgi:hypothetical protein